jgi:hypothetical protein
MYQIGHSPQISSELALIVRFGYFSFQYFSKDDPTMETKALSTKEDPIGVHKVSLSPKVPTLERFCASYLMLYCL